MAVKSFVFVRENTCRTQISQNYTSYYQLTFSESNGLNTPVIFAWLSIKAISKQQNGQKHEQHEAQQQNAGCTANEAEQGRLCLESVTLNLTGNALPGACLNVLPLCSLCVAVQTFSSFPAIGHF